jgi:hypothetical protein
MRLVIFVFFVLAKQLHAQNQLVFNWTPEITEQKSNFELASNSNLASPQKVLVRPFITDDARVVGSRLAQLESWIRIDKETGQHWILAAYGPNKNFELTAGGVYGYQVEHDNDNTNKKTFAYALPLLQAKVLFNEYKPNKAPGSSIVIGTFLPAGQGSFKPAGYGTFGYLAVSECLGQGDKFLFHGNLGGNYLHIDGSDNLILTWGLGTQIKAYKGMHLVLELFSGDPYVPGTGTSWQVGFRHFFSDLFQIDMTVGNGVAGEVIMPFWFSAGVRIVTETFLKKKNAGR